MAPGHNAIDGRDLGGGSGSEAQLSDVPPAVETGGGGSYLSRSSGGADRLAPGGEAVAAGIGVAARARQHPGFAGNGSCR